MSNPETASIIERLIACRDTLKVVERQYSVNLQPERAAMADAANALAALAQPKEGEALSDEVVERAARADADMAAALLEGLEALANTPMNIDFSVWSRFAFNVQMIAKRLRRAAITPAGGVDAPKGQEAEGWKLVPVEPTREMYAASGDAVVKLIAARNFGHDAYSDAVWAAMLATSPTRDEAAEGNGQDQGGKG